jgi:endogenous inhibitor of DNA gyrase (YacG/DUF329 family)
MANMREKVAYLQGLTKGLNVSDDSSEGKILLNIIDVLGDMADEFDNVTMGHEDLENYVETLDEDLTELEETVYEDYIEVECPFCHETVTFESNVLDDDDAIEVTCPHCGEVVYDNMAETTDDIDSGYADNMKNGVHPGI